MSARSLMNLTCTIRRPQFAAASATGYPVATFSDNATGVRCAVQAMSSNESRNLGRDTGATTLWVFLPVGTDIKTQDRIIPGSGQWSGRQIAIIGPPQDEAGRGSHLRMPAELMEGGGVN